uniref:Uncharacterized protein n=1 Tax=Macaca fascicularis TaxID=9541 RepID=A0A7N9CZQ4_MACFA
MSSATPLAPSSDSYLCTSNRPSPNSLPSISGSATLPWLSTMRKTHQTLLQSSFLTASISSGPSSTFDGVPPQILSSPELLQLPQHQSKHLIIKPPLLLSGDLFNPLQPVLALSGTPVH